MLILGSNPVLAVHDLDRSATWFTRVLGCERTDPDPGNWAFCRVGAVTFMLGRCPDVIPARELGDHSYIAYLDVDAVDEFYERAIAERAEVLKAPTDGHGADARCICARPTGTDSRSHSEPLSAPPGLGHDAPRTRAFRTVVTAERTINRVGLKTASRRCSVRSWYIAGQLHPPDWSFTPRGRSGRSSVAIVR